MYGLGNIKFTNLDRNGAPFPANAAFNGTSVDAVSGRIQFASTVKNSADGQLVNQRFLNFPATDGTWLVFSHADTVTQWSYITELENMRMEFSTAVQAGPGTVRLISPIQLFITNPNGAQREISMIFGESAANGGRIGWRQAPSVFGPQGTIISSYGTSPNLNLDAVGAINFYNNFFPLPNFTITAAGTLYLRQLPARTAPSTVLVRDNSTGDITGVSGFSGIIPNTFTNITVVDGIITATT